MVADFAGEYRCHPAATKSSKVASNAPIPIADQATPKLTVVNEAEYFLSRTVSEQQPGRGVSVPLVLVSMQKRPPAHGRLAARGTNNAVVKEINACSMLSLWLPWQFFSGWPCFIPTAVTGSRELVHDP
jgi:hypothetical protein